MRVRSKLPMYAALLSLGHVTSSAQEIPLSTINHHQSMREIIDRFTESVITGDLRPIRSLMFSNEFTFDQNGDINSAIKCFFLRNKECGSDKSIAHDILTGKFFLYYDHISEESVVVSFIREDARKEFYSNPSRFLEKQYMNSYFSCHMAKLENGWYLTESLCFSETEGPYEVEIE